MGHLPAQSCAEHRRHGFVRSPDHWLRSTLCLYHYSTRPQRPCLDQRHNKSDSRMDRASDNRAFPWHGAPRYLIRDRDHIYGATLTGRLRAMGIRDKPIAPLTLAEWFCRTTDWVDPARVRRPFHRLGRGAPAPNSLKTYAGYYNKIRTHRSLDKDAPAFRPVQRVGNIASHAILGGLHHHYVRI